MNRFLIILLGFYQITFSSCKDLAKTDFLEVETLPVSGVTKTNVQFNGQINELFTATVERYGFVWSNTIKTPTESMNDGLISVEENKQSGAFFKVINNLLPNTIYHVSAFAQLEGAAKIEYGLPFTFVTNSIDFVTEEVRYELGDTARIFGKISGLDISFPISQHGHVWSVSNKTPKLGIDLFSNLGRVKSDGTFSSKINDLENHQTYYMRAYLLINLGKDTIYEPSTTQLETDLVDIWVGKKTVPIDGFSAAPSFTINGKFYVGKGAYHNFWEYDPQTDCWKELLEYPYPGQGMDAVLGFSIDNKGYVGLGNHDVSKKIWEFDPSNQGSPWTEFPKEFEFPGEPRRRVSYFVINKKAYIIAGDNYTKLDASSPSNFKQLKDVWEFDPSDKNNPWKQKKDFKGAPRNGAMHFSVGNRGYLIGGNRIMKDVWEYNPMNDTWIEQRNFPGGGTEFGTAFSLNGKGYMANGTSYGLIRSNVFWEYNPMNDTWIQRRNMPGAPRTWSNSFSINNKGYVGFGTISGGNTTDLWEYTPKK